MHCSKKVCGTTDIPKSFPLKKDYPGQAFEGKNPHIQQSKIRLHYSGMAMVNVPCSFCWGHSLQFVVPVPGQISNYSF